MSALKDITGQTFGRLTVIERSGSRDRKALWRCHCSCGRETVVIGKLLRTGRTRSCGCLNVDINRHLHTLHNGSRTRLSRIWRGMLNRCRNPKAVRFKDYGGRGIVVCNEWLSFVSFRDWALANGYRDDLSIERMDNDGNYEPTNCTWIPLSEQWRNQRLKRQH